MQNELSKLSVKSEIKLNADIKKIWKLFSTPSHLELFHPFCLKNEVVKWDGIHSEDRLEYLNGRKMKRKG